VVFVVRAGRQPAKLPSASYVRVRPTVTTLTPSPTFSRDPPKPPPNLNSPGEKKRHAHSCHAAQTSSEGRTDIDARAATLTTTIPLYRSRVRTSSPPRPKPLRLRRAQRRQQPGARSPASRRKRRGSARLLTVQATTASRPPIQQTGRSPLQQRRRHLCDTVEPPLRRSQHPLGFAVPGAGGPGRASTSAGRHQSETLLMVRSFTSRRLRHLRRRPQGVHRRSYVRPRRTARLVGPGARHLCARPRRHALCA